MRIILTNCLLLLLFSLCTFSGTELMAQENPVHAETENASKSSMGGSRNVSMSVALSLLAVADIAVLGFALFHVRKLHGKINGLKEEYTTHYDLMHKESRTDMTDPHQEFEERLTSIMEKNLGNVDFNMADFAAEMAMSRSSFYNRFSEFSKVTPNEYIRAYRLKRGAELLLNKNYNIAQVAAMVGFPSASYFIKLFRAEYGVTPKEYRTRMLDRSRDE